METSKDLNPLLTAIKSEKQAIVYYTRAGARITNPTGKAALLKLKKEEEKHYKNLRQKFKKVAGREPSPAEEEGSTTAISPLTEQHLPDKEASDLEVCQIAIKDENTAHGYYLNSARVTDDPETKKLYEELAKEETGHIVILQNICKILSAK